MTRRSDRTRKKGHPAGHPTGMIGTKGDYQRRQLGAVVRGDRVFTYHATKGWLNRRA